MVNDPMLVWVTVAGVFVLGLSTGRLLYKPGTAYRWPYALLNVGIVVMMTAPLTNPPRIVVYSIMAGVAVLMGVMAFAVIRHGNS